MPYRYGYTVSSGQRLMGGPPGFTIGHMGALRYLFWRRISPDVEDILGYTALDHCTMALVRADFARVLLEHGTDVNHRDRFGSVPVVGAFQNNAIDALDVLMEFDAELNIADADDVKPGLFYLYCGPQVTAAITPWNRKRAGESAPGKARHWTGRSDCSAGRRMVPSSRAPNALPCAPSPRSANMRRTIVSVGAN